MKLKLLLSVCLLSTTLFSFAQDGNKAFAITSDGNADYMWMNIRQVDLTTGSVISTIYERGKTRFQLTDAVTNKTVMLNSVVNEKQYSLPQYPTATMVAAAAFDKKHGKLFFTPMALGELRWLNLSSGTDNLKFYAIQSNVLNVVKPSDEATHITRMAIGADGNGYAITNDANHLITFTTGKKTVITDLGSLVDAESNNHLSVHNKCSSWGGDIVADAYGKLYLFTASRNVFKIDIETKTATYLGSVAGLSGTFTINGAAVDNDNNIVVSSANTFEGFYKVNIKDLAATKINTTGQIFNASDLANSNLLYQNEIKNTLGAAKLGRPEIIGNNLISIYPNPVIGTQFKVSFDNNKAGVYNVAVTDVQGRLIMTKEVYIKSPNQIETLQLKIKPSSGLYMIKVTDGNKKNIFSDKLMIQ